MDQLLLSMADRRSYKDDSTYHSQTDNENEDTRNQPTYLLLITVVNATGVESLRTLEGETCQQSVPIHTSIQEKTYPNHAHWSCGH